MIGGRSYPSYSPSFNHRQRRSFRKLYYGIFVVLVIFIWHSGKLTPKRHVEESQLHSQPLASRSQPEIVVKEESHRVVDAYGHHIHKRPAQVQQEANPKPSPMSHEVNALRKDNVESPKLTNDDDPEIHDTDVIDTIKDTVDENVNRESKLSHPDDDDTTGSDSEHSSSSFGNTQQQARLGGNAHEDHEDDDTDTEVSVDDDDTKHPIQTLREMTPWTEHYELPSWEECNSVKEKADALPDMIHVPFEQSVKDVILEGWEDQWIAKAHYAGPKLEEPKIDFVYNWVNGSQPEFTKTMRPYELNSSLNDAEGTWIASHSTNRYREWNELRYSMRSVEKYAGHFTNRIQILVNAFENNGDESQPKTYGKQKPHWLKDDNPMVQVLSQEEFFGPEERKCLPTFDSLTIENQLYNTKSEVDRLFALSDDMILGKPHSAADLYSPLFGPTLGFKDNAYNTLQPPTEKDAERFGEKPFLIYTSWLLNRRFGARKRKGQVHFGHSLSRSITKEAITSFPRPALRSAAQRFRGETGFQLYSWYVIFHYTMERHREALLWSYIMLRSDVDDDGYLDWTERKKILKELAEGMGNDTPEQFRHRIYYRVADHLESAGLQPPKVNTEVLWTSLDGPAMIKDVDCDAFDTEDCLAPGFSMPSSDATARSPVFSSAAIFDRIARQSPRCGDCLIKLLLNRRRAGLGPLLPHAAKKPEQRATVIKALIKYQYTIVQPDAMFYMVTDAEQAEHILLKPYIKHNKKAGQICLNDDVVSTDKSELERLADVMAKLFDGLLPHRSNFEKI